MYPSYLVKEFTSITTFKPHIWVVNFMLRLPIATMSVKTPILWRNFQINNLSTSIFFLQPPEFTFHRALALQRWKNLSNWEMNLPSCKDTKGIRILKCEAQPYYARKIQLVQNHALHFHKVDLVLTNDVFLIHYL